jgi:hypothetical protein
LGWHFKFVGTIVRRHLDEGEAAIRGNRLVSAWAQNEDCQNQLSIFAGSADQGMADMAETIIGWLGAAEVINR